MPRWVYAPEYNDLYVVDDYNSKEHEHLANELYKAHDDTPTDSTGWNKWWGGMIYGGPYTGDYDWVIDYYPLAVVNKVYSDSYLAKQYAPEGLKTQMAEELEKYKNSFKQAAQKTAATIVPLKVVQDESATHQYAFRDIQAEPDVYDPQFWLENRETKSAMTFAYIGGQLILAQTHHQGIMAAMMSKGWDWEDFFTAPQLWGWLSQSILQEVDRPEPRRFVRVQFTSDSGHQNEELIPECLMAFADKFKLPVVTFQMMTGVGLQENDTRGYGGGLTHNPDRVEDPHKQERGLENVFTEIQPPVRTSHFAALEKNAGRTWRWQWTPKHGLDIWEGAPWHGERAEQMWGDDFYDPYAGGYIFEGNPGDVTITPYTDREQTVPPEVLEQLEAYRQKILEEDERLASVEYVSGDITLQIFEKNGKMRWSLNDKADGYFDPEKFRTTIVHNDYGSPGKVTEIVVEAFSILPKQALNK